MIRFLPAATLFCLLFALDDSANAVIVRQGEEEFRGYLVEETESRIVVNAILPGGGMRRRTFSKADVRIIRAVKPERLAELREDAPRGYFEYADELSAKTADPDARLTALRLYVIAAYLDPARLARSSLQSMAMLAESQDEWRRYRALAYLLDPEHDPSLLESSPPGLASGVAGDSGGQKLLRQGLRAFWSGRQDAAAAIAKRADFRAALAPFEDTLPVEEFVQAAKDKSLPPSTLRKAIELELALSPDRSVSLVADDESSRGSWSKVDWQRLSRSTGALELGSITEFDPRQCRYRDGSWVEPE